MNFININSRYNIAPWHISFVKEVLQSDRHYPHHRDSLFHLFKEIPFYLVNEIAFNNVKRGEYFDEKDRERNNENIDNDENNKNREVNEKTRPNTEVLGLYISKGAHGIPEIYLCMEATLKHSKNEQELTYLLAKVIIHELAHAYMDRDDYGDKDEFYSWMEESCANEITLEHFEEYEMHRDHYYPNEYISTYSSISPYKYVKDFILSQPDNYKLGYYLHENRIHDYMWWRMHKDEVKYKTKAKNEWLNYVKSKIHSGDFDRKTLDELTNNVLLKDHYSEVPKK